MLNITKGKELRPLKVVVYGPEGVGKSTFSSKFPNPLFIDTEGGTSNLDVNRIKCNKSWDELIAIVKEVITTPSICKTLVIDTADWAEILCINAVCDKYRVASIETINYGKGYTYVSEEFNKLLSLLDKVIEVGINVVVTAHAKPRKFELPEEMGQFDRYEMKLTRQVAPMLKEWCDCLFFTNYKIYVVTSESNKKKAQGGKRVLYTTHNPTYDAKNRFGLPEELDLDFDKIKHLFNVETPQVEEKEKMPLFEVETKERATIIKLNNMIGDALISEDELKKVVASRGYYKIDANLTDYTDDFITRWIIPNWKKIIEIIKGENKDAK